VRLSKQTSRALRPAPTARVSIAATPAELTSTCAVDRVPTTVSALVEAQADDDLSDRGVRGGRHKADQCARPGQGARVAVAEATTSYRFSGSLVKSTPVMI